MIKLTDFSSARIGGGEFWSTSDARVVAEAGERSIALGAHGRWSKQTQQQATIEPTKKSMGVM